MLLWCRDTGYGNFHRFGGGRYQSGEDAAAERFAAESGGGKFGGVEFWTWGVCGSFCFWEGGERSSWEAEAGFLAVLAGRLLLNFATGGVRPALPVQIAVNMIMIGVVFFLAFRDFAEKYIEM